MAFGRRPRAAAALAALAAFYGEAGAILRRAKPDPHNKVQAVISPGGSPEVEPDIAQSSTKYLLASFPSLKQVAYCHLPDNVWRPLVLGEVKAPTAVAVDTQSAKLFVADPPSNVIWWYKLHIREGFLETVGGRHAAVEGVDARALTVNSVGDLYFAGRLAKATSNYSSIYRQDASKLVRGNSLHPTEVYNRSTSGSPNPMVWDPAGLAVDSLFLYWGNQASGQKHGSVVKGSRMNIGLTSGERKMKKLSASVEEVRGIAVTGTHLFYLSPGGVYGVLTSAASPITDPSIGLVSRGPPIAGPGGKPEAWNPTSIAWDGDNSLYFTDAATQSLYTLPARNVQAHNLTKYADAPGVHGVAVIGFTRSGASRAHAAVRLAAATAAACLALAAASALP